MKKYTWVTFFTLGVAVLAIGIYGSVEKATPEKLALAAERAKQEAPKPQVPQIAKYGNDVYLFPWVGDEFRRQLAAFLEKNPDLEFAGAVPEVWGSGYATGHTVVFRKKK